MTRRVRGDELTIMSALCWRCLATALFALLDNNQHLFGAPTTLRENTALAFSLSALFFSRCRACMPVRSVTGVALMMLSKASLSPMSEPDSASESMGRAGAGRVMICGAGLCVSSGGAGFTKGFDCKTRRRSSAISSSSSESSDMSRGSFSTPTPPSSSSSSSSSPS